MADTIHEGFGQNLLASGLASLFAKPASYRYTPEEIDHIGGRMAESECLDELLSHKPEITQDEVLRSLVADFYRRHRRACITIAKFAGVPVAHGLFLSSLPF